jgi:hypothetical protein
MWISELLELFSGKHEHNGFNHRRFERLVDLALLSDEANEVVRRHYR